MDIAHEASQGRFVSLLFGIVFFLIVNVVAFQAGFYRKLPPLTFRPTPSFGDLIFIFLAFFSIHLFLLPIAIYLWLSYQAGAWQSLTLEISEDLKIWLNGMAIWISSLGIWAACRLFQPSALQSVIQSETSKNRLSRLFNFGFGCLVWLIAYPIVFVVNQVFAILGDQWFAPVQENQMAVKLLKNAIVGPYELTLYLIAIIIVVPLVEEFMFRGILQRWLISRVGRWPGIFLASLCFAGMHYAEAQGAYNFQLLPSLFVLSCYLGYLYERQGTLWAPLGLHAMFNFISASMVVLTASSS
ncbi:MAG: CPBP family intramembrane glutamic endopeptidase [Parachlamydiaceae bacterium]